MRGGRLGGETRETPPTLSLPKPPLRGDITMAYFLALYFLISDGYCCCFSSLYFRIYGWVNLEFTPWEA